MIKKLELNNYPQLGTYDFTFNQVNIITDTTGKAGKALLRMLASAVKINALPGINSYDNICKVLCAEFGLYDKTSQPAAKEIPSLDVTLTTQDGKQLSYSVRNTGDLLPHISIQRGGIFMYRTKAKDPENIQKICTDQPDKDIICLVSFPEAHMTIEELKGRISDYFVLANNNPKVQFFILTNSPIALLDACLISMTHFIPTVLVTIGTSLNDAPNYNAGWIEDWMEGDPMMQEMQLLYHRIEVVKSNSVCKNG